MSVSGRDESVATVASASGSSRPEPDPARIPPARIPPFGAHEAADSLFTYYAMRSMGMPYAKAALIKRESLSQSALLCR
jgi:hypothetical protein